MKKLYKFLSIVCIFTVLLSVMILPVNAKSSVTRDNFVLLEALNIFDGSEKNRILSDDVLTRADSVYYAIKVCGYDEIPKASEYSYSDVNAETKNADYIIFAKDIGMIADGDYFRPDDKVTMGEFIKMIEKGLGYSSIAERIGGFPDGYMVLADRAGFLNAIGSDPKAVVSFEKLPKLLSNVLLSGSLEYRNSTWKTNPDKNLLYDIFDVYLTTGIIDGNSSTLLRVPKGLKAGEISIDGVVYHVKEKLYPELLRKIGYSVRAWVKDGKGDAHDYILCYENDNQMEITEIYSEDFLDYKDGTIYYVENNRRESIKLPAHCLTVYNGKACSDILSGDVFNGRWGSIQVIKPDGWNIETIIITAYENYFVGGIDPKEYTVYDNTSRNSALSFKINDKFSENAIFRTKLGKVVSFSDISEKSVLSVARNDDYFDVIITNNAVKGRVTALVRSDNGLDTIVVDNNEYLIAPEMKKSYAFDIKVGKTYLFYLDAGSRIAAGI